jgi:hypothetical protein
LRGRVVIPDIGVLSRSSILVQLTSISLAVTPLEYELAPRLPACEVFVHDSGPV